MDKDKVIDKIEAKEEHKIEKKQDLDQDHIEHLDLPPEAFSEDDEFEEYEK